MGYTHILNSGHMGSTWSSKRYFTEPVTQALVDEVVSQARLLSDPDAAQKVYYVAQMGRVIGQKRTLGGAFIPAFDVTLVVQDDNCESVFRTRNEVVTMYPGLGASR